MTPVITAFISRTPLDAAALATSVRRDDCGAVVVFEGNVRSPNEGEVVDHLDYEAYERVAIPQIRDIAEEVATQVGLSAAAVAHRTGQLSPGETAFLVAVAAPHRQAAFTGGSIIVDRVKAEAAIWKTENRTSKS